jgi:hypothetical protein
MAFPHLEKLKLARLTGRQAATSVAEETLSEITSSDLSSLSGIAKFDPSEYQVALIRQGKVPNDSKSCRFHVE